MLVCGANTDPAKVVDSMSGDRFLLATDGRGIATLTLNRPEVANAYDEDLLRAMTAALETIAKDERCARW